MLNTPIVIFDFETTGLSIENGDRAIEIGAVKLERGVEVSNFSKLMNPGFRVSSFIEDYTGISNAMLAQAQSNAVVMNEFAEFIEGCDLVAHNASFDQRFLEMELAKINRKFNGDMFCSLLLSRRLIQEAPSHKLGELVRYLDLPMQGCFHRALDDARVTGHLWQHMLALVSGHLNGQVMDKPLINKLSKLPKAKIYQYLTSL
ncbi:PolC-type DNA polymerase III [Paraferrimonas sp. SM1919]|uniref:3'-5' exonuclease n=1 Tax=Paraferrimonas sp. SM1919 TaxID=2662263 RepID=UPI0013D454FA|nr:3'-5' exonuclease [Paraferrimonas sp. SM1919]